MTSRPTGSDPSGRGTILRDARDRACRRAPLPGRAAQRGRKNRHGSA